MPGRKGGRKRGEKKRKKSLLEPNAHGPTHARFVTSSAAKVGEGREKKKRGGRKRGEKRGERRRKAPYLLHPSCESSDYPRIAGPY